MPPETKQQPEPETDETPDAAQEGGTEESRDERARQEPGKTKPDYAPGRPAGPGFFTIYKKGQGYWTRMGTALGALLLIGLTAYHIYLNRPYLGMGNRPQLAMGIAAALFAVGSFFAWRAMNKPSNVDFLIATDSEMKKVNWTSRKDLIGSTKVVIVFMFLIAAILFIVDIVFSYFFFLIGVLKHSPFGSGGTIGGG
jgi:preprotein translocase SecE subunit